MAVADARGRRWDAATGLAFCVVALVSLGLPGSPPKADDPTSKVVDYFTDKRGELLASSVGWFVAALLLLWWLGSLRSYLRAAEGGEGRLSIAAFGGGVTGIVLTSVGFCASNAAAFKVAGQGADPNLLRALYDLSAMLFAMGGLGFAVLFGAAACSAARSGALPSWLVWVGAVAFVLGVLGLVGLFAKSGELAIGGFIGFLGPLVSLVWVAGASVVMIRRDGVPPVPLTEP